MPPTTGLGFTTDHLLGCITLLFSVVGGIFAYIQWRKSNEYKRSEFVKDIVTKMRDDEDIAFVTEIIDWNSGLSYDGKFHFTSEIAEQQKQIPEKQLFQKIDKTLSHCSYVCYLKSKKIILNGDMAFFEYAIKRLIDNPHIANYLYSLHHWSNHIHVSCSFSHLIQYALDKQYLESCFTSDKMNDRYTDYLYTTENMPENKTTNVSAS